jgi:hypothetical protein
MAVCLDNMAEGRTLALTERFGLYCHWNHGSMYALCDILLVLQQLKAVCVCEGCADADFTELVACRVL